MAHVVTDRFVTCLYWAAGILLALAVLSVMTAIGWTTSADSLIRVVYIASLAFGIPAAGIYALAVGLTDKHRHSKATERS